VRNYAGQVDESIRRELTPGERVLWTGQPNPAAVLRDEAFGIVFLTCWLAGVASSLNVQGSPQDAVGSGIVLVMLAGGAAMLAGCIFRWLASRRTLYAVTDTRLIVVRKGGKRPVIALRLDQITGAERTSSNPDKATIRIPFGAVQGESGAKIHYLKLYGVREPGYVFQLLTR
jgi:hypothetical protein